MQTDPRLQLILSAGSGRVMNCDRITHSLSRDPNEAQPKMFDISSLNHAFLIKDVQPRIGARAGSDQIRVRTRLYLPFDPRHVFAGGQMIEVGTRELRSTLSTFIDMSQPERVAALDSDLKKLDVVDKLPTLAPFLLRDRLERAGFGIAPAYFEISEEEWQRISSYIREEFQRIVAAVFGDSGADNAQSLALLLDKLWNLNDREALEQLAMAFKLPKENCEQTFYAWKGIIYFTYEYGVYTERIKKMLIWVREGAKPSEYLQKPLRMQIEGDRERLWTQISRELREINERLRQYRDAFNDLFEDGRGSGAFLGFLAKAKSHFEVLGLGIGRVQHAVEVWEMVTRKVGGRGLSAEMLQDLLGGLNEILFDPNAPLDRPRNAAFN